VPRQPAHQGEQHGDAGRRRNEVLHRERQHLGEVAHGAFAGVSLPIGIGDEADRGVERGIGSHRAQAGGVQRQGALRALQGVHRQHAQYVEREHRQGIAFPAHVRGGVDAAQPVNGPLQGAAPGRPAPLAVFDGQADIAPQQRGEREQHGKVQRQQSQEIGIHQNFSGLNKAASRYAKSSAAVAPLSQ